MDSKKGVIIEPCRPEGPLIFSDVQAESVYLSWKPPQEDGGSPILGYVIEAKDVLHVDIRKTYIWSEGTRTECRVHGLQTCHIYQFRVYAQNKVGRGEGILNKSLVRIKAATRKPPKTSKPTAELIDQESILLKWNIPEGYSDLNFIVERFEAKSGLWMQCNHQTLNITSYLATDLIAGKEYIFRVSCEDAHGVGLPSESSDPILFEDTSGEPPTIVVPVADCFVKVDEPAFFSCEFTGTQPMQVNWLKDGIRIREGFGANLATEATTATLKLNEVDSDDDDCTVQCDLRNSKGKASSQAKIRLLCPPRLNCLSSYKEGLTYDEGDHLRLKAMVSGKPTPSLTWYFNRKELCVDDRTEIVVQPGCVEAKIQNVCHNDAGMYECIARNIVGEDSLVVQVMVTGPPTSPCNPEVVVENDQLALLKWAPPSFDGGSSVFNYLVEIRNEENGSWQRFASGHSTCCEIINDISLKNSSFRIRAVNIYGVSDPSLEIQLNRDEHLAEKHVEHPKQGSIESSSVQQSHETPNERNLTPKPSKLELVAGNTAHETWEQTEDDEQKERKIVVSESNLRIDDETNKMVGIREHMNLSKGNEKVSDRICNQTEISEENEASIYGSFEMLSSQMSRSLTFEDEALAVGSDLVSVCESQSLDVPDIPPEQEHGIVNDDNVGKFEDIDTGVPLNILYVAIQTLNAIPNLNHACMDVHDFEDLSHFAAEVTPLSEHAVEAHVSVFCYTICSIALGLEYPFHYFRDDRIQFSYANGSWIPIECSPDVFFPIYYDTLSVIICQKSAEMQSVYKGITLNVAIPLEQTLLFAANRESENIARDQCLIAFEHKEAITVSENLKLGTYRTECLSVNIECNYSISTFESMLLEKEGETREEETKEVIRTNSIKHIPQELEVLAGLKCVSMTLFKPALSVLPFRTPERDTRQIRNISNLIDFSDSESENDQENADVPQATESDLYSYILDNIFSSSSDGRITSDTTGICQSYFGNQGLCQTFENNTELKENIPKTTEHTGNAFKDEIPDWLRFVSPNYIARTEDRTNAADETADESLDTCITEYKINPVYSKDKRVQELLTLAEAVEHSFTQKAEQFESLENILQQELDSLEKDLEAVNKINRTLWKETCALEQRSGAKERPDVHSQTCISNALPEKDLINFDEAASKVQNVEAKQDQYAPQVISHLQNKVVHCGCRTRLYCFISGNPDPQIVWLKNGKLLPKSTRYVCSNLVEFGVYIDIFNAKSSDSGEYLCIATNCHGSAQTLAYLRVIGPRENSPEEPKFLEVPDDVCVQKGKSVCLEWKMTGTPVPHVVWFKNAEKIETNLRMDTFSNHRGYGRLTLHDVTTDDTAIYTCYLENEAGSSVSTVMVSVEDGDSTCGTSNLADDLILLSLLDVADESCHSTFQYYERLVQESLQSNERSRRARPTRKMKRKRHIPGPPFSPAVLSSGSSWVMLSWSPPTSLCKISAPQSLVYRVEKKPISSGLWREVGRTRNTLFTASGFKPGQSFMFRIFAGDGDNWGPPAILSQPVHCTIASEATRDQMYS